MNPILKENYLWDLFGRFFGLDPRTLPLNFPTNEEIKIKVRNVADRMLKNVNLPPDTTINVKFVPALETSASSQLADKECRVTLSRTLWSPPKSLIRDLNDSEFAAVLGHEIGHCLLSLAYYTNSQIDFRDLFHQFTLIDLNSNRKIATSPFFWRAFETDADEIGLRLMKKSGFDPKAAQELFCRRSDPKEFSQLSKRSMWVTAMEKYLELEYPLANLDSHPSDEDRCLALRKLTE